MTNDEVFLTLKQEGIKEAVRGYITNAPKDFWTVFTNEGNIFLLDDNFFIKYSINPIFRKEWGELYFQEWQPNKYKKNIYKKRVREKTI